MRSSLSLLRPARAYFAVERHRAMDSIASSVNFKRTFSNSRARCILLRINSSAWSRIWTRDLGISRARTQASANESG